MIFLLNVCYHNLKTPIKLFINFKARSSSSELIKTISPKPIVKAPTPPLELVRSRRLTSEDIINNIKDEALSSARSTARSKLSNHSCHHTSESSDSEKSSTIDSSESDLADNLETERPSSKCSIHSNESVTCKRKKVEACVSSNNSIKSIVEEKNSRLSKQSFNDTSDHSSEEESGESESISIHVR